MGLCKCPRKKVTNLFCFQHKVNVCEHCLVASHPKCVVQSYLRWLRDSDFNPVCRLCDVNLDDDDCGDCVRLMCFDVFHWRCLDRYCRGLPSSGDLAHYQCPTCQSHVFPAENVVSPLAEALRTTLASADWARAGLGLPEYPSAYDSSVDHSHDVTYGSRDVTYDPSISYDEEYNTSSVSQSWNHGFTDFQDGLEIPATRDHVTDHVVTLTANEVEAHMRSDPPPTYEKATPTRGVAPPTRSVSQSARSLTPPAKSIGLHKLHGSAESHGYDGFMDTRLGFGMRNMDSHFRVTGAPSSEWMENDDKYKRRTPAIWAKVNSMPRLRRCLVTVSTHKLFILILILCLAAFIILDSVIKYGRTMADREPFLDPMANPNIRIEKAVNVAR